jgi:hypothetical protein
MSKKAIDVITQLYAIKLVNYVTVMFDGAQCWRNESKVQVGKTDYYKNASALCKSKACSYIEPVFKRLKGDELICLDEYQNTLFSALQKAKTNKIIDKKYNIVDMKKFIETVLKNCKLPNYVITNHEYHSLYNAELFHGLTGADFTHIIKEQIEQVFNEKFFEYQVYKNGVIWDRYVLEGALAELWLYRFVNNEDVNKAVGTDGLDLSRKIANKIIERVR